MAVTLRDRLLERESDVAVLRELIAEVSAGRGSLVVIEGPAGIGKTRLVEETHALARAAGLECHGARGSELERDIPYSVVRQLFEPLLARADEAERRRLLGGAAASASPVFLGLELVGAASSESSYVVLHGLYWLTVNLAARSPLALTVDDVHWADAASLRALAYLANRLAELPILVVVAMRSFEPGAEVALLEELTSNPLARSIRPSVLSELAVAELLERALDEEPAPEFTRACHQATKGNPFFLREVSATISAEEVRPTAAQAPRVAELAPPTVSRSVKRRLERLPDAARALARAAAVLGEHAQPQVAAEIAGLRHSAGPEAADALARAEILKPESLEFVHPIVRSVVYSDMSPLDRGEKHAQAARALADARASDDQVALQLLASAPRGDQWCVNFLRAAARSAAQRGATDLTASYLERALVEPPAQDQKPGLVFELGTAAVAVSGPDGLPYLREALELADDPDQRVAISLQLAASLFSQGYFPEAAEVLQRALAGMPGHDELTALLEGQLFIIALTDLSVLTRFGGLKALLDRIDGDSGATDPLRLAARAWIITAAVGPASAGAELANAVLSGGRLGLMDNPPAFVTAATALMGAGRHVEARQAWDQAVSQARRDGVLSIMGMSATLRAPVALRLGSVEAAEADAREVYDRAREANRLGAEVQVPISWVLAPLIDALLERGEIEEASQAVEDCAIGHELPELLQFNYLLDSLGRLRLAQGRREEGIAHLRECGRRLEAWGIANPGFVPWRSNLACALAMAGEREEALDLARAEHAEARRFDVAREEGMALRAMALAEHGERELELLGESVRVLEATTARLELARSLVDLGVALRRRGQRSKAREPLRGALDLAERAGADVLVERAHTELLATGARPRRLQLSGLESLTASERRVAELAAEGSTNRQIAEALFVTEKTVEGHLGNTYRKLDVSSRSELPRALAGER